MKKLSILLSIQFLMLSTTQAQDPMRELRRQQRQAHREEMAKEREERREERRIERFEEKKAKVLERQAELEQKFFEKYDNDFRKVKKQVKKALDKLSNDELITFAKLMVKDLKDKGKLEESYLLSQIESDPKQIRIELEHFMSDEKEEELRALIKADIDKVGGFYNYMFMTQRKTRTGCWIGTGAAILVGGAITMAGAGGLLFVAFGGINAIMTGASFGYALLYPAGALTGAFVGGIPVLYGYDKIIETQMGPCSWDYRQYTLSDK